MKTPEMSENLELMDVFYEETQSLLDEMRKDLLALKKEGATTPVLERLFRCAHSVKGSSGCVGFYELNATAQALERIFKAGMKEKYDIDPNDVILLSGSVEVCQKLLKKEEVAEYKKWLERLREYHSR